MRVVLSTILFVALAVHAAPIQDRAGSAWQSDAEERQRGLVDECSDWQGYRQVGYYPSWAIYDDIDFLVTDIHSPDYTHLIYAFANVDVNNGTVYLSDPWADLQYPYPGDNDDDSSQNELAGNTKQLFQLKKQQRNLKTLLSIGGWSYRDNFVNVVNEAWRNEFARSSVALMEDLGMDGLDIDYEYATGETKEATIDLVKQVRAELNGVSHKTGTGRYLLSYASPCGSDNWNNLDVSEMDGSLDMWTLMAYDFSGDWSPITTPASNLYPDNNPDGSGTSVKQCVDFYLGAGATARKINVGMPTYGTAFNGTTGMWASFEDVGGGEDDEPGFYADRHLPIPGETDIYYNATVGASWSYSSDTTHLTSFDIPYLALQKAKYVVDTDLGGMAYWSIDSDWSVKHQGSPKSSSSTKHHLSRRNKWQNGHVSTGSSPSVERRRDVHEDRRAINVTMTYISGKVNGIDISIGQSLAHVITQAFNVFGRGLDQTRNVLSYPESPYANIRS